MKHKKKHYKMCHFNRRPTERRRRRHGAEFPYEKSALFRETTTESSYVVR
jgi:hypothetical protein